MKYLFSGSIEEFKKFTKSDLRLDNWIILDGESKERYNDVCGYSYIKKLKELYKEHGITCNNEELISWLDSQSIMLQAIQTSKRINENLFKDVHIIQEFHIPFTNKRADYLLIKDNKIIIIEFSYVNSKMNKEYHYNTKLNQVIGYKELISNIMPKDIEIGTYTFLVKPSKDYDKTLNSEGIINLIEYIDYFMKDRKISALEELNKLPESN